jgi:hypothetical protein
MFLYPQFSAEQEIKHYITSESTSKLKKHGR